MKNDYLKIAKIVKYEPSVFRRLKLLSSRERIINNLEKKIKKHEEFNKLADSLDYKAREEMAPYIDAINSSFDKSVKKYKEMFNVK